MDDINMGKLLGFMLFFVGLGMVIGLLITGTTAVLVAAGLEFDQVFALFPEKDQSVLAKQGRYIAATRALHRLHMYEYEN